MTVRDDFELYVLGRAVVELRARKALSQEALGFAAELHRNYIGGLERGEHNPSFLVLTRLAGGLTVPLSELIKLAEDRRPEIADRLGRGGT